MRLRHIEIFHAVYTCKSITNAAKMLKVSQPSVSKVLSHAEITLGFKLFERVKGRLIPTDEAEMFFTEVDKVYQQILSVKKTAENIKKSDMGNITIGHTPAFGFDVLPSAIAQYYQSHSKVHFNLQIVHNSSVMQALNEKQCDLALMFSPPNFPGIKSIELSSSELVVVYPKSLVLPHSKKVRLESLTDFDFIDISTSGPLGDLLSEELEKRQLEFKTRIKVETYFIAAKLVAKDLGFSIIDKHTAMNTLSPNMEIASLDPPIHFSINILHLEKRSLSNIYKKFIDLLKEEIERVRKMPL